MHGLQVCANILRVAARALVHLDAQGLGAQVEAVAVVQRREALEPLGVVGAEPVVRLVRRVPYRVSAALGGECVHVEDGK